MNGLYTLEDVFLLGAILELGSSVVNISGRFGGKSAHPWVDQQYSRCFYMGGSGGAESGTVRTYGAFRKCMVMRSRRAPRHGSFTEKPTTRHFAYQLI